MQLQRGVSFPRTWPYACWCMNAVEPCLAAGHQRFNHRVMGVALYADPKAVMDDSHNATESGSLREKILVTLSRLTKRITFDATTQEQWPDTHKYKPELWEASDKIGAFLTEQWNKQTVPVKFYANPNGKFRLRIAQFGGDEERPETDEAKVDLIRSEYERTDSKSSIEDMLAMDKIKGDPALGKSCLFSRAVCPP